MKAESTQGRSYADHHQYRLKYRLDQTSVLETHNSVLGGHVAAMWNVEPGGKAGGSPECNFAKKSA